MVVSSCRRLDGGGEEREAGQAGVRAVRECVCAARCRRVRVQGGRVSECGCPPVSLSLARLACPRLPGDDGGR